MPGRLARRAALLVVLIWLAGVLPVSAVAPVSAFAPRPSAGPAAQPRSGAQLGLGLGSLERHRLPRFWVHDRHRYRSPWYAGAHRKMVAFGCTRAPYYDPDPRCTHRHGFHHGLDIAMPCGTRLFARYRTRVVHPSSSGALGPAYGPYAIRLRSGRFHKDFVIGHVRKVFVRPGDLVRRGQLVAKASNAGAPDGCHLHFEVRPRAGGYRSAVRPYAYLGLRRVG